METESVKDKVVEGEKEIQRKKEQIIEQIIEQKEKKEILQRVKQKERKKNKSYSV